MSEAKFEHTAGLGGDLEIENGIAALSGGIQEAVYLSLFGGNLEGTWWGDLVEVKDSFKYPSLTQKRVIDNELTSAILPTLENTVKADLEWMLLDKIINDLEVSASITAPNTVEYVITVTAQGEQQSFNYTENWEEVPPVPPAQALTFPAPVIGWIPASKALKPVAPAVAGDGYLPTDIKE